MFNRTIINIFIGLVDLFRITLHRRSSAKCAKMSVQMAIFINVFPLLDYSGKDRSYCYTKGTKTLRRNISSASLP
jgi:hypothetical protein